MLFKYPSGRTILITFTLNIILRHFLFDILFYKTNLDTKVITIRGVLHCVKGERVCHRWQIKG